MSGDYLADLRIRIEPDAGAVASLREVLLVVPAVQPGQEEALDALVAASTARPAVRAVARVVADYDRDHLPGFCLIVAGESGGPFALVHGAVEVDARGGGEEVRLTGLASRLWVEQALPATLEQLSVRTADDAPDGGRLVLEATVAAAVEPEAVEPEAVEPEAVEPEAFRSGAAPASVSQPDTPPSAVLDRAYEELAHAEPDAEKPDAEDDAQEPVDGPVAAGLDEVAEPPEDSDRGRMVIAAPVAIGGGSSSHDFRPEQVRFDGGRMETVTPPPAAVNGWHEPPGPASPPAAPPVAVSPPLSLSPQPSLSPPLSLSPPTPPDPFARPAEPSDPFARPAEPKTPQRRPSGLPMRTPQAAAPMDRTQVVAPPGRFDGQVPPPVPHSFNPFEAVAPRPPESDRVSEPAAAPPAQLGRLVMDNGPDVVVDRDCVIGRNPEVDPEVAHGRAKPIVLPDEEQRISRVHARLVFSPDRVEIVDAGSVNGTWIEPPGGDGWIAMVPRVPAPLPMGSRIQVGDLVLSYHPVDA